MKKEYLARPLPEPNSQRDNQPTPIAGSGSQCHYAMIATMAQQRIPEARNDRWIYDLVDDMEPTFGRPGIGERIRDVCAKYAPLRGMMRKRLGMKGEFGAIANVHAHLQAGLRDFRLVFQCGTGYSASAFQQLVNRIAVMYPVRNFERYFEILPGSGSIEHMQLAIRKHGAVIGLSTMITRSGHFVPVVGYNNNGWLVQDPWGDWMTGYRDRSANTFTYAYDRLHAATGGSRALRGYRYSYLKTV